MQGRIAVRTLLLTSAIGSGHRVSREGARRRPRRSGSRRAICRPRRCIRSTRGPTAGLPACHFGDEVRRLAALAGAPAQRGTLPAVCEAPVEVRLGDLADGTDLAEWGIEHSPVVICGSIPRASAHQATQGRAPLSPLSAMRQRFPGLSNLTLLASNFSDSKEPPSHSNVLSYSSCSESAMMASSSS